MANSHLTIYPQFAILISPKRRHSHLRNPYPLLRRMAYRCQQSRLRRRYRYDRRSDVHALPQCPERYRADAAVALFNRHPLTPPLLETVARPKRNTPYPRFCPRHRPRKPNFKGHLRCSSEKGDRRHRMSFRRAGIFASLLAAVARKFGRTDQHSTPIQTVARASCGDVCRGIFNACTHGWTRCRDVSPSATPQ